MILDRADVAERVRAALVPEELGEASPAERRLRVRDEAIRVLRERGAVLPARELARIVNEVSDEVVGLGPIEGLLRDPEVSEVMVNGADTVFVERKGRLERVAPGLFVGEEAVYHLIERVVGPLGLRVDESSPTVDARLPDGSRFHAIIPPLSLCGPTVTVRKFGARALAPNDLLRLGTASEELLDTLADAVRRRANVIVTGGAASGKTTLLGVLSAFVPSGERIITIEDAAELRLAQPHVVALEARPASVEGRGAIGLRDLVRNALRMRPDRIVVGEVRGAEALDMLQAMHTGQDGSMSTLHASAIADVVPRLETLASMSDVRLPSRHLRAQIASAFDVVVHMTRASAGGRVVAGVAAFADGELHDLFVYDRRRGRHERRERMRLGRVP